MAGVRISLKDIGNRFLVDLAIERTAKILIHVILHFLDICVCF
jgi:hypothetical protein